MVYGGEVRSGGHARHRGRYQGGAYPGFANLIGYLGAGSRWVVQIYQRQHSSSASVVPAVLQLNVAGVSSRSSSDLQTDGAGGACAPGYRRHVSQWKGPSVTSATGDRQARICSKGPRGTFQGHGPRQGARNHPPEILEAWLAAFATPPQLIYSVKRQASDSEPVKTHTTAATSPPLFYTPHPLRVGYCQWRVMAEEKRRGEGLPQEALGSGTGASGGRGWDWHGEMMDHGGHGRQDACIA